MPLLLTETIQQLAAKQRESGAAVVLLAADADASSTFGRVVRGEDGRILEIVEVANARRRPNAAELINIREQNAGVYCFDATWLWANIDKLPLRQARSGREYYLTDMIELAVGQGLLVEGIWSNDPDEALGAGTRAEMVAVEKAFRRRANRRWLNAGVTLVDPESIYIDPDVTIGQDTVIWPNSYLQGRTQVGADCVIGPNTIIRDSILGDQCRLEQVVLEGQVVPAGSYLPPFTHLRGEL
jgi:bifunctional UDP-N-acetylglucosamine pyrophosphorylase/glucosamine-1-phosphate N-acetyltransferase